MQGIYSFSGNFKFSLFKGHGNIQQQISFNCDGDMSDCKCPFYVKADQASLLYHWDHRSQSKFPLKIWNIVANASKQNNPLHIGTTYTELSTAQIIEAKQMLINKLQYYSILNGFLLDKIKKILRIQESIQRISRTMTQ